MSNSSMDKKDHLLFHGELSDAPGRYESWDERLSYRGNNRWVLLIVDLDTSGAWTNPPTREQMGTKALVHWVMERDAELEEGRAEMKDARSVSDEEEPPNTPGPRAVRLRQIAIAVGSPYCVACLDRWQAGSWFRKRSPALRVLDVKGVTKRQVWIRVSHPVYQVETNLGPAYMYPPEADQKARLILTSESSMSSGRKVRVTNALLAKVAALKPELDALRDPR